MSLLLLFSGNKYAYIANGVVCGALSAATPGETFSAAIPGATFTGAQTGATFTGAQTGATFTGATPTPAFDDSSNCG